MKLKIIPIAYTLICLLTFGKVVAQDNTANAESIKLNRVGVMEGETEMLKNGNFEYCDSNWVVDQTNGAKGQIDCVKDGFDGYAALRIKVLNISDAPWRLQIYQKGLRIEKRKSYIMTFWVKSDRIGDINVNCMQNHEPWDHSTQQKIPVSTEWKQLQFNFAGAWDDDNARVTFTNLGTIPGQVYWIADCSLLPTILVPTQK